MPKRILILNDHVDTLELYKGVLETAGYECLITTHGEWALSMLRTLPFDLLIQDIKRPVLDGWSLLRKLKSDPALQHIQVLIVSAAPKTSQAWELEQFRSALAGYLEMPVEGQEFIDTVERILGNH